MSDIDNTTTDSSPAGFVSKLPPRVMKATRSEMYHAQIPHQWRDYCAHLLIPLNKCRDGTASDRVSGYLPWNCSDERHVYEKCLYEE